MEQDMQNEKPGKANWTDRLEDAEVLSAFTLQDKTATWNKLHSRLNKRSGRKKTAWYWAAAAGLLIVMTISFLTISKMQTTPLNNTAVEPALKQLPVSQFAVVNKQSVITPGGGNRKITIADRNILRKTNSLKQQVKDTGYEIPDTVNQINDAAIAAYTNLPAPVKQTSADSASIITTVAAMPVKKQLKVVHINELEEPAPAMHNKAVPADYGVIQLRINRQVYTPQPLPYNSTGYNISSNEKRFIKLH